VSSTTSCSRRLVDENCSVPRVIWPIAEVRPRAATLTSGVETGGVRTSRIWLYAALNSFEIPLARLVNAWKTVE
jgi:hypothetical protein